MIWAIVAAVLSILGVAVPILVAVAPRIGLCPLSALGQWRLGLAVLSAALLGVSAFLMRPEAAAGFAGVCAVLWIAAAMYVPSRMDPMLAELDELGAARLAGQRIIGLVVGDVARAYPAALFERHSVVHDRVAESPILLSYCAASGVTCAYSCTLRGVEYAFDVAGLYRRNLVIRDRQTESLWQQMTGQCIHGENIGFQLDRIEHVVSSLEAWLALHPDSTILGLPKLARTSPITTLGRRLGTPLLRNRWLGGLHKRPGAYLNPQELVLGLKHEGRSRAFSLRLLADKKEMVDEVGESTIGIRWTDTGAMTEPLTSALTCQWHCWAEFNPHTSLRA